MNRPQSPPFSPPMGIEIRETPERGLGVFATQPIREGESIEEVPVLIFPTRDLYHPGGTAAIASRVFVWDDGVVGLAMGFGSFYNHSTSPNARYEDGELDESPRKRFIALREIAPGEEITINYNGESDDDSPVGFDVIE